MFQMVILAVTATINDLLHIVAQKAFTASFSCATDGLEGVIMLLSAREKAP